MEHLAWGLQMTVLGMGLVFALLGLLWGLLTLVLFLDKEAPTKTEQQTPVAAEQIAAIADAVVGAQVPEVPSVNGMPADLVAAILVATMKHKQTLRRQAAPMMRGYWPDKELFASRWVAAGRARQNNPWQARGK